MNLHPTHNWRYSDSSLYDAVCTQCNCTNIAPHAKFPCGNPPEPTRLLELAQQAGLKASSETALSPTEEKFAQLIIEECRYVMDCNKGSDQAVDWNAALFETSKNINKHFGIEE